MTTFDDDPGNPYGLGAWRHRESRRGFEALPDPAPPPPIVEVVGIPGPSIQAERAPTGRGGRYDRVDLLSSFPDRIAPGTLRTRCLCWLNVTKRVCGEPAIRRVWVRNAQGRDLGDSTGVPACAGCVDWLVNLTQHPSSDLTIHLEHLEPDASEQEAKEGPSPDTSHAPPAPPGEPERESSH